MSMRRVAANAGIEFGNLTYHYPSRVTLVTELLDAVFRAYDVASEEIKEHRHLSPEYRLVDLCHWVGVEAGSKHTARLMPELWALANKYPFVARRLNDLYCKSSQTIVQSIQEMRPDLNAHTVLVIGIFVVTPLDSLILSAGYKKSFSPWASVFGGLAAKAYVELVKTVTADQIGDLPPLNPPLAAAMAAS
jgi:AcrR family transcriptional regulator